MYSLQDGPEDRIIYALTREHSAGDLAERFLLHLKNEMAAVNHSAAPDDTLL